MSTTETLSHLLYAMRHGDKLVCMGATARPLKA